MEIAPELITLLPKTDLHLHLDGSLRPDTLVALARSRGVALPSETTAGLFELVFKERYGSLSEYLEGFRYTVAVLQDAEALEQAAWELMEDNVREGVRYIEVRFAPQLHVHPGLGLDEVLRAVDRGLARAAAHYNATTPGIRAGLEPPYAYGIIACAMRKFEAGYSDYYRRILGVHQYAPPREVYPMAAMDLIRAIVDIRDRHGTHIVAFDLAGDEAGYPAMDFKAAYDFAHRHFIKKTVHAGEAYGPESIFQAITELHADRIGHGLYLFDPGMIRNPAITDRELYVERLGQYIADRRITIEVCLSSNLQTNPGIGHLSRHAFGRMKAQCLSCTLCTDNRLVSRTSVSQELQLALDHFPFTLGELKNLLAYGFKRSFFPGPYREKRDYVRKAISYFEHLERTRLRPQNSLDNAPAQA